MTGPEIEYTCPDCGNFCIRDEVDIGVGTMYSPWRCSECGWSQQEEADEYLKSIGLGGSDVKAV